MLALVLVLVPVLAGCARAPRFVGCPYSDDDMRSVVDDVRGRWVERFASDPRDAFDSLTVECRDSAEVAFWWRGHERTAFGVTLRRDLVLLPTGRDHEVAARWGLSAPTARESALAHELAHVALWDLHDDPDSGHGWRFRQAMPLVVEVNGHH